MDVYGLIGNPVGHSLSPIMHEAGFDAIGLDARYVTFQPPVDAAGEAVAAADLLGVRGLNVTIPFKQAVIDHVEPDEEASRIGAVNTIDFQSTPPSGHNTDVRGAMRALERHDVTIENRTAVLLGAGGAARAIGFGLMDAGAELVIANRTLERAEALAADLGAVRAMSLDTIGDAVDEASLLINATSVGMESNESPVSADVLHADLVVMDAVYRPLETRLLRDAVDVGAEPIDGAWMLLYQGVAAFERWTGRDAPVDTMNDALRESL